MKTRLGRIRVMVKGDIVTVLGFRRAERGRFIATDKIQTTRKNLEADLLSEENRVKLGFRPKK